MYAINEDDACVPARGRSSAVRDGAASRPAGRRPIWGGLGIAVPLSGALWALGYLVVSML